MGQCEGVRLRQSLEKSRLVDHKNVTLYDAPIMEISSTLIRNNIKKIDIWQNL